MGNERKLKCKLFILPGIGVSILIAALLTYLIGNHEIKTNVVNVNFILKLF